MDTGGRRVLWEGRGKGVGKEEEVGRRGLVRGLEREVVARGGLRWEFIKENKKVKNKKTRT